MPDELGHPSQVLGPVEAAHVSWALQARPMCLSSRDFFAEDLFEAAMRPPLRPGFQRLWIPRPSLPKLTPSASWKTIGVLPEESGFKTI